jgi:hypothetical protein
VQRVDDGRRQLAGRVSFRRVLIGNRGDGLRARDQICVNACRQSVPRSGSSDP